MTSMSDTRPGSREDALQQVVTEQRVVGNSPGERGFEEIDVVDPLAAIRALAE